MPGVSIPGNQVCLPCHVPHNAYPDESGTINDVLWNHQETISYSRRTINNIFSEILYFLPFKLYYCCYFLFDFFVFFIFWDICLHMSNSG